MRLPSAKFSQFIETESTLTDVSQCRSRDGRRLGRQLLQGEASRTIDALGIGIVLMHDPVECIKELVLQIHRFHHPRVILSHKPPLGKTEVLFQPLGLEAESRSRSARKIASWVKYISVSPPFIDRRDCGVWVPDQ